MSKKVSTEQFTKSLANLEKMAKSQLYHTDSDSNPGSWAGSTYVKEEKSMDDDIDANGLDYNSVKKALGDKVAKGQSLSNAEFALIKGEDPIPHIINKIEKGLSLTPAEQWVVKAVQDEDDKEDKEDEDKDVKKGDATPGKAEAPGTMHDASNTPDTNSAAKDEEEEAEVSKSLDSAVNSSYVMKSGIEMSPFLYEFVNAVNTALQGVEARVTNKLNKSLDKLTSKLDSRDEAQAEFFKSLAESVVGIGELTKAQTEEQTVNKSLPTRGPKSATINKSIGGISVDTDSLQKSQILDVMVDMVKSNQLSAQDVIAYEHTNHLPSNVRAAVTAFMNDKR